MVARGSRRGDAGGVRGGEQWWSHTMVVGRCRKGNLGGGCRW